MHMEATVTPMMLELKKRSEGEGARGKRMKKTRRMKRMMRSTNCCKTAMKMTVKTKRRSTIPRMRRQKPMITMMRMLMRKLMISWTRKRMTSNATLEMSTSTTPDSGLGPHPYVQWSTSSSSR